MTTTPFPEPLPLMAEAQELLTAEQMTKVSMEMAMFQAKSKDMSDEEKLKYVSDFTSEILGQSGSA